MKEEEGDSMEEEGGGDGGVGRRGEGGDGGTGK